MFEKLKEMHSDATGKPSWNRWTATTILLYLIVAAALGQSPPVEMIEILRTILSIQVGSMAISTVGASVGPALSSQEKNIAPPPPSSSWAIFLDARGKVSWNRCMGALIILFLIGESIFLQKPSKVLVDALKIVLTTQIGAGAVASAGVMVAKGYKEKKTSSTPANLPKVPEKK